MHWQTCAHHRPGLHTCAESNVVPTITLCCVQPVSLHRPHQPMCVHAPACPRSVPSAPCGRMECSATAPPATCAPRWTSTAGSTPHSTAQPLMWPPSPQEVSCSRQTVSLVFCGYLPTCVVSLNTAYTVPMNPEPPTLSSFMPCVNIM
jgi:hypothetical protein